MCGITGFWTLDGLDDGDSERVIGRMMDRLAHRGPDGRGWHLDRDRGLAMGHTRLAIVDPTTGAQPLRASGLVVTVNGEFYDYRVLRAELARTGEEPRTRADSELALPLYRRHGLDFVHRLRGEFALALWDAERQRLVLVRDRFGVRPLYVHRTHGAIVWGSEAKAILAHPRAPRRLSPEAALGQMMNLMVPGRSAFEGIEQILPGHMLVIDRDGDALQVRDVPYWDLDFPPAEAHAQTHDARACEELVAERLIDAVRVRLDADVPVGCYLSGGVDSSSLLGLAAAIQQTPVRAFTIGFDDPAYDESGPARDMAARARAEQVVLPLEAQDLYGESYVRAVRHAERAFYNPFNVAKYHLSRAVRAEGYRVVLTGEGADELFAGYPFFKQDLARAGRACDGAGELERIDRANELVKGVTLAEVPQEHPAFLARCGFTPSWLHSWIEMFAEARPLFHRDVLTELGEYDPVGELAEALDGARLEGRHPLDQAQYTYVKALLESQVLAWSGDRMDMAHGVESRPPFLDHRLAETAATVPPGLRIRDGVEKWILREAVDGLLPASLVGRPKFAFMAPPSHVDAEKRRAVGELAARHLSTARIRAVGLFDERKIVAFLHRARVERRPARRVRDDAILNQLLGLHILHDELIARPA